MRLVCPPVLEFTRFALHAACNFQRPLNSVADLTSLPKRVHAFQRELCEDLLRILPGPLASTNIHLEHHQHFGVFVTGEAETDEPLFVQMPCRRFQQLHPTTIVLDQIVVGCEDL